MTSNLVRILYPTETQLGTADGSLQLFNGKRSLGVITILRGELQQTIRELRKGKKVRSEGIQLSIG
jgi:hypothetical protein